MAALTDFIAERRRKNKEENLLAWTTRNNFNDIRPVVGRCWIAGEISS